MRSRADDPNDRVDRVNPDVADSAAAAMAKLQAITADLLAASADKAPDTRSIDDLIRDINELKTTIRKAQEKLRITRQLLSQKENGSAFLDANCDTVRSERF